MTPEELDKMRARKIVWMLGIIWEVANSKARGEALDRARAIREAEAAAGLVTVPREPTAQMVNDGLLALDPRIYPSVMLCNTYRAMISAATGSGEG